MSDNRLKYILALFSTKLSQQFTTLFCMNNKYNPVYLQASAKRIYFKFRFFIQKASHLFFFFAMHEENNQR